MNAGEIKELYGQYQAGQTQAAQMKHGQNMDKLNVVSTFLATQQEAKDNLHKFDRQMDFAHEQVRSEEKKFIKTSDNNLHAFKIAEDNKTSVNLSLIKSKEKVELGNQETSRYAEKQKTFQALIKSGENVLSSRKK